MKITQELRPRSESNSPHVQPSVKGPGQFAGLVREGESKLHQEGLDRLFHDIEKQAQRMLHSRTVGDFLRFKQQVQQFVKEAVGSGLELQKSRDWHRGNGMRTFTTVKKVNENLTELTDQFLNEKRPAVDLLAKIGEIQGLLINLYR